MRHGLISTFKLPRLAFVALLSVGAVAGVAFAATPPRGPDSDAAAQLRLRRADPYAAMLAGFKLSETTSRRLRELLRVPEVVVLEVEGELSRGAYRSRQEAVDIYNLACNEAEAEIQSLLTPLQYARLKTVRDELPARRFVTAYEASLSGEITSASAGQIEPTLSDEIFAALLDLAHSVSRRQGVSADYTTPEDVADEAALARYLEAKRAADAAITQGAAAFLTPVQLTALTRFQSIQRENLATLWRQRPALPWVRRR